MCKFVLSRLFRYGKIYLKSAKSCLEKGADYPKKEINRLQRMLDKVTVHDKVKDDTML